jgi:hypothetical protein
MLRQERVSYHPIDIGATVFPNDKLKVLEFAGNHA